MNKKAKRVWTLVEKHGEWIIGGPVLIGSILGLILGLLGIIFHE